MKEKLIKTEIKENKKKMNLKQFDYSEESYLSKFFFYWAYKIINMSQKIPIKVEYLGKLNSHYSSQFFFNDIFNIWEKKGYKKRKYNPLLKAILRNNIFDLIFVFISTIINSCLNVLGLYLFRIIIQLFIEKNPVNKYDICLVSIYLIIRLFDFLLQRKIAEILRNLGNKSSVELNCLVYYKLLKLSPSVDVKSGQIYNLIQSDSIKLAKLMGVSPNLLSIPFLIIMYNYLLFKYMGISFIFGFIVMIIFFIVNIYYRKQFSLYLKLHIKKSDMRMKLTTQTFNNLKVIKLYGWDDIFLNRIEKTRKEEIDSLNKRYIVTQISQTLLWLAPIAMSVAAIGAYQFLNERFKIEDIFTCIGIFTSIQNPMKNLPVTIDIILEALVSLSRIEKFLSEPEINENNIIHNEKSSSSQNIAIKIENGTFSWGEQRFKTTKHNLNKKNEIKVKSSQPIELLDLNNNLTNNSNSIHPYENKPLFEKDIIKDKKYVAETPTEQLILTNINLEIKKGEFICIIGEIGSGKSSLVQSLLNNMICLTPRSTKLIINGKISYLSQENWIQNTTIKENILFNHKYSYEKYDKILELCELKPDLNLLEGGDLTEIGEKGINLSGGQNTRVALARAMYSDGDIFILDDPISSLDANTGKKIMNNCIINYLKDKTRILVTHSLQYTKYSDRIIYMKNGKIEWEGIYSELIKQDFYNSILNQVKTQLKENNKDINKEKIIDIESDTKSISSSDDKNKRIKRLTKDEKKVEGKIDKKVFFTYFTYIGGISLLISLIITLIFWQTFRVGSDIWLGYWSEHQDRNNNSIKFLFYAFLALGSTIFNYIRTYIITNGSLKCSIRLHREMILNLINAPINLFHDTIPKGQIFNRLSKDLPTVDTLTMYWFMTFTSFGSSFLGAIIICSFYQPYCLIFVPFFISTCLFLSRYYMNCSRELSRIEGILNSPILNLINETIPGASIIRAYHLESKFNENFQKKIDEYFKVLFYLNGTYQWYLMMLNVISFLFLVFLTIFTLIEKELYSAKVIGIILSYSLIFQSDIIEFLSAFSNFENTMTKMERSLTYTNLISEKPQHLENDNKINWPTKGEIEFINYSTRYRPDTKIVLKNLSFKIESNKRIGIVGRTGSGKSTIALCLFRILESLKGKILIDGIDISTIGLQKLRKSLTILPQDSTIVDGTLRYNIDPVGNYSDSLIEEIMKKIGFYHIIENNQSGLDQRVSENGSNLSIGEKQMICITRAILRKSKIIVMDESTASIDYQTEETILKAINEFLKDSTIITIAHRIKTIINYDKILVLDNGSIVEYDTPENLMKNKNSEFYSFYEKSLI